VTSLKSNLPLVTRHLSLFTRLFSVTLVVGHAAMAAATSAAPPRRIDSPAPQGSLAPALSRVEDGFALTWLEPSSRHSRPGGEPRTYSLRFSRLAGGAWTTPVTIVSGNDFFLGWADVPSVSEEGSGRLLAHWSIQSGESVEIGLARSEDAGKTWKRLFAEPSGHRPRERSFLTLLPDRKGVRAAWLEKESKGDATSLRVGFIGDGLSGSQIVDPRVCDCCQVSSALTAQGPLLAYRDRSAEEIRDISVARRTAAGWSAPSSVAKDNWKIEGCPVNGPAAAAAGRAVAVAWFTVAQDTPRVQVAFSADSGATFGKAILVDGARPLGRVGVVLDDNGDAIVSWAATEGGSPTIRLRRVSPAGRLGEPVVVSSTSVNRANGVPSLVKNRDTLGICWLEHEKPATIHVALEPAASVP
jgi:hypothetical protein